MPQPQRESWKESDAELFRLLVENVTDYAIFILDPQGYVASWNPGAERIKGYKADEIIGQHFSRFYPQEAIERKWPAHELEVAKAEGRFEDEGGRVRKDGSLFWANVVITALYDGAGTFRGFSKITRDLTDRKQAEENARRLAEETAARRSDPTRSGSGCGSRWRALAMLSSARTPRAGWTSSTPSPRSLSAGKPRRLRAAALEDVFRIVNEDTRQPVENPALRALKDGSDRRTGEPHRPDLEGRDGATD